MTRTPRAASRILMILLATGSAAACSEAPTGPPTGLVATWVLAEADGRPLPVQTELLTPTRQLLADTLHLLSGDRFRRIRYLRRLGGDAADSIDVWETEGDIVAEGNVLLLRPPCGFGSCIPHDRIESIGRQTLVIQSFSPVPGRLRFILSSQPSGGPTS